MPLNVLVEIAAPFSSLENFTISSVLNAVPIQFFPIYSEVKKSKDTGSYEDFVECLKLYDKMENGTMMLGELEHILLSLGEKLEREEVDILIKECCDPEDDDGFIPYERKSS